MIAKRCIEVVLVAGLGFALPAWADNAGNAAKDIRQDNRAIAQDNRDIAHDKRDIANDRRDLHDARQARNRDQAMEDRAVKHGDMKDAQKWEQRREHAQQQVNRDKRDLARDERDLHHDRAERNQAVHDRNQDVRRAHQHGKS